MLNVGHRAPKCWAYVEMLTGKTAPKYWPMLIYCPPSAHGTYMNSWKVSQNCSNTGSKWSVVSYTRQI
eukprot:2151382-Prymnesium_polylepis.2